MKAQRILSIVGILTLAGCSHSASKAVDDRIAAEPQHSTAAEIHATGLEAIEKTPGLSDEQKAQIKQLFNDVSAESAQIRGEMGKLKGVLFKEMLKPKSKASEVRELRKRLLAVNNRKMVLMLEAMGKVERIVRKNEKADRDYLYRVFLMHEGRVDARVRD